MKKTICFISAFALIISVASACGVKKNQGIVYEGDGGYVTVETQDSEKLPKMRTTEAVKQSITEESQTDMTSRTTGKGVQSSTKSSSGKGNSHNGDEEAYDENGSSVSVSGTGTTVSEKTVSASTTAYAGTDAPQKDVYYLEGIVYKSEKNNVIVNDPDLGFVSVEIPTNAGADKIKTGDNVVITHNGEIKQGELFKTGKANTIEVVEKAKHDYKYQLFKCQNLDYDLKFSLLMPSDWTSRNIEYPTEGDFTDWGIRLAPNGETTGLDISWHNAFAVTEPYDITPITVNGNDVKRYSKNGNWHFYVYESNSFLASNGFYNTDRYETYTEDIEFILETLIFDELKFLK